MKQRTEPVQQLLGIARPDPGVSHWRGPRELSYVIWRREQRYKKRKLSESTTMPNLPRLGRMP